MRRKLPCLRCHGSANRVVATLNFLSPKDREFRFESKSTSIDVPCWHIRYRTVVFRLSALLLLSSFLPRLLWMPGERVGAAFQNLCTACLPRDHGEPPTTTSSYSIRTPLL